jgi:hypothetical protein
VIGFFITSPTGQSIRFHYYLDAAPATITAFHSHLPFSLSLFHARVSGQEIWSDQAPQLAVIQENASVFTQPGEVVIGPVTANRAVGTAGTIGIYYGEGKGLDCANIFAKVIPDDFPLLQTLGEQVWKAGAQILQFTALD